MYYETMSDMILDNRNGAVKEAKECKTKEEAIEVLLDLFDWLAVKAIENQESYKNLKQVIIDEYGEDEWENIEEKTCTPQMIKNIMNASRPYYYDIRNERKVGYSALEEGDDE